MEYHPFEQQSLDLGPTLHNELRHKRTHTHPPAIPNAKRACTQCVLCRVSLYSNEEIIHHLSTREHIGAVNQFPEVRLQDILIPESYIEDVLAGKYQTVGIVSQIHEEVAKTEHTPNVEAMPAGASRPGYYTRHTQEERSPMEDTSPLGAMPAGSSRQGYYTRHTQEERSPLEDTSPLRVMPAGASRPGYYTRHTQEERSPLEDTSPLRVMPAGSSRPGYYTRHTQEERSPMEDTSPLRAMPAGASRQGYYTRHAQEERSPLEDTSPLGVMPAGSSRQGYYTRHTQEERSPMEDTSPLGVMPAGASRQGYYTRHTQEERSPMEDTSPLGVMPAGASRQGYYTRHTQEERSPMEDTSSLGQTNFQLSGALREFVQKLDTSPSKASNISPPFNTRVNFPRRDSEMYPAQLMPTLPRPSQKPTPNFPRRDVETFREYPEPRPSQKPTPNFPRRDVETFRKYPEQLTPTLPQPSQEPAQRTPRLNTYTQPSHTETHSYHQSQQTLHDPPLLSRRLGHPFPYTTQIQLPSQELVSPKPPLTPTLPQPSQNKPQGPPQVTIPTPPIHSPDPAEFVDVKEHMIHCKVCGIIVPNQFHWEAHIKRDSHLMNLQQSEEREAEERDEAEAEAEVVRVEESKKVRLEEEMTTELMKMEEEDTSFYKEELEKESEDIPPESSTFMPPKRQARTRTLAQLRLRCGYCDVIIHERRFWPAHIKSRRHLMASTAPDKESPTVKPIPLFYCDICDVSPLDEPQYAAHIGGRKHKKKLHFKEMSEAVEITDAQRSPVKQKGTLSAKFSLPQLKGKVVRMKPKPAKLSLPVRKPTGVTMLKKTPQGTALKTTTPSTMSWIPETSQRIVPQSPTTSQRNVPQSPTMSQSPGGQVATRGQHSVVMTTEKHTAPDQTLGKGKIIKLKRSWRRDGNSETSSLVSNESATLQDTAQKSQFTFDLEAGTPSQQILKNSKTTKPLSTRRSPILPPSPAEGDHPPQAIRCISQRQVKSSPHVTNPQTIKPTKFHGDSKTLRKQPSVPSQLTRRSNPGTRERSRPAVSPVPPSRARGNLIPRPNPPDRLIQEHSFSDTHEVPMRLDYQQPIKSEYSSREEADYHAHIEQMRSEAELELWGTGTEPGMDEQLYGGEKGANIQRSKSPMENTEGEEEIFPEFEIYPDTPDFEQYHDHDHELSVDRFKAARKKQQEEGIDYEGKYDFTSDSPELQVVKTQSRSASLERRKEWEYPNSPNVSSRRDRLPITRVAGVHPNYTPPIFRNAVSGNRVVSPRPIFRNAALQHSLNQNTAPSGNIPVHDPSPPIFRDVTLQHGLNSSNHSSSPSGNHVVPPPIFRNVALQHGLTRSGSPATNNPGHLDPASSPPIFRNVTLQHGLTRSSSPATNNPGHLDPASSPPIFRNVALQHGLTRSVSPATNNPGHIDPASSPPIFRNVALQHGLTRSVSPATNNPGHLDPASSPPIFRNVALQHSLTRSGSPATNNPVFRNPLLQRSSDSNGTSSHSSSQTQSPSGNLPVPVTIATSDRIIADTSGRPRAIQTIDYYHGQKNPFIGRNPFLESKQKEFLGIWPNKWNNGSL